MIISLLYSVCRNLFQSCCNCETVFHVYCICNLTAKWPLRSSSQAATCYYQSNHSKVVAISLSGSTTLGRKHVWSKTYLR